MVIVGLVVWAVVVGVGRGAPAAAPTTSSAPRLDLPGRLLVLDTTTGRLASAAPDGSDFTLLPGPAYPANDASVSPDGSHAVVGGVQVVDIGSNGPTRPLLNATGNSITVPHPWADKGTRIVLMTTPAGDVVGGVETVELDGRSRHSLGADAGGAAGDPTRDGAIVAVLGDTEVNLGPYTERNTSRVEWRWWKGHTKVLATTRQLLTDAGLPDEGPYVVQPVVSPDGRLVALSIDELTPNANSVTARHALVVMGRSGKVLTTRTSFASIQPVWNDAGTELAFLDEQGVVLVTVTGDRASTKSVPAAVHGPAACLFSPSGDRLLCDDRTTGERSVVGLADGHVAQVPYDVKRVALAWLASVGGGP